MTTVETLKEKYDEVGKQRDDAEASLQTAARNYLDASLKELFESHPDLESFYWTQYTPHFNDGDPCVFSAHVDNICIKYKGVDPSEDEDEDESDGDGYMHFYSWSDKDKPYYKAGCAVINLLGEFGEDFYETQFASEVTVVVTRNSQSPNGFTIETDHFEHD